MVSGPGKRNEASMPVRASGERLARSSTATRTSSSKSMSSAATVTGPAEHEDGAGVLALEAQAHQRLVELAREGERPPRGAGGHHSLDGVGDGGVGAVQGQLGGVVRAG